MREGQAVVAIPEARRPSSLGLRLILIVILMLTTVALSAGRPLPNVDVKPYLSFADLGTQLTKPDAAAQVGVLENYGKLPLSFEVNEGQTDPQVRFLSPGNGHTLFLTPTEAVLTLNGRAAQPGALGEAGLIQETASAVDPKRTVLRMEFVGANPESRVVGLDELPGKSNYFIGNDPKKWYTNVPTYSRVKYKDVYPCVDLVYYGNQGRLECDFIVAPGSNPDAIKLSFKGADELEINDQGDLILHTPGGEIRQRKPLIYQEINDVKQTISGHYVLKGKDQVGFQVSAYDVSSPVVIDPVLVYSTYLGGSDVDKGVGIAVDADGNAYMVGRTDSVNFPTQDPLQPDYGGYAAAFIAKLNGSLRRLSAACSWGEWHGALLRRMIEPWNAPHGIVHCVEIPKESMWQT